MNSKTLRAKLIRLAYANPKFRKDILPLVGKGKNAASGNDLALEYRLRLAGVDYFADVCQHFANALQKDPQFEDFKFTYPTRGTLSGVFSAEFYDKHHAGTRCQVICSVELTENPMKVQGFWVWGGSQKGKVPFLLYANPSKEWKKLYEGLVSEIKAASAKLSA